MSCFSIAYHMDIITGPAGAIYKSINQTHKELAYGVGEMLTIILITTFGFIYFGYSIMVINVCVVSSVVVTALLYMTYNNYSFGISQKDFWCEVMIPGLVPYGIGFVLIWIMQPWFSEISHDRWQTFHLFLMAFFLYTTITIFIVLYVLCRKEEKTMLLERFVRIFRKNKS